MAIESAFFRATLKALRSCGITTKDFAEEIDVSKYTLYNYVCGQPPALRHYQRIMSYIKHYYPEALKLAEEQMMEE